MDSRVDLRFAYFLQDLCSQVSRGPKTNARHRIDASDARWFMDELASHASRGLFVGTMVYAPFGCPSWMSDCIKDQVLEAERVTGRPFEEVVIEKFRATQTQWRVLAESHLPGFDEKLSSAVKSTQHTVFPAELIEAKRQVDAEFRAKAFTEPRDVKRALGFVEGLGQECLELLALAETLAPGTQYKRTNGGRYVAIDGHWISFQRHKRRGLYVSLRGTLGDFIVAAELALKAYSDPDHVQFLVVSPDQIDRARDYIEQAAKLRATAGSAPPAR